MRALATVVLGALALFGQDEPGWRDARLAAWREALELDLPAEALAGARPHVEGGRLARDGEALALYSRALVATGGAARARALLESAAVDAATRPALELALAELDLVDDRLDAVEARLALTDGEAPVRFAQRPESWLTLGRARVRAGRAAEGAPLLRVLVERWPLHPDAPSAWHMLAQEALARRDAESARACRERGQELASWHAYYRARRLQVREHPEEPLPRLGLAQLWLAVNELEQARAVLTELVAIAPGFCRGWATLGEVERKSGALDAARAAYDRALGCDAGLAEVRFNRALIARAQARDADARADLEVLLASEAADDARFREAHLMLARLLIAAGEETAADERYSRYRELGGREPLDG